MLKKNQLAETMRNAIRLMAIVMLTAIAAGLQSCTDDEEPGAAEYPAEILGSWEATRQTVTTKVEGLEPTTATNEDPQHLIDIQANGVIESFTRELPGEQWISEYRGAWAYNDFYRALIVAPNENERLIYYVHNVTANQLVLVNTIESTTEDGTACNISYATAYTRPQAPAGGL